ncbi:SDR family NAD(P)-dependent oxidoreductase [Actinomadura barringtoniae]|uniref:SDR family NAD(P)-dependent oxidoreductase n=1 Tax=Actinomadura barringtoniae TaxID=1427535 RepID=A0A939T6Q1_9ACTN|nr:SDR family NAD(P)-dependent oxidoreductase [Actinomadura barringtoniae]MBO2455211.1 SDR family NAD(P)-dependent oxidoreductase [Actinomadura barringtoniae]
MATSHGTVLITGGTGSLGRQAARAIAEADPRVHIVITGRGAAHAEATARTLREQTKADVTGMQLDLGSLAEVQAFAERLTAMSLPPLRGLVCNAGLQNASGARTSKDGYELTFAVNHLAHFALIQHLRPHLDDDGAARIVMVASDTHDPAKPTGMPAPSYTTAEDMARPGEDTALEGRRRYTMSKLCNVLMAYELARRLSGTGITVNAFDPGLMPGTGLAREYGGVQAFAWRYVMPALVVVPGLNIHTPRRSGRALGRLVTAPEHAETTGEYFSGYRRIPSSDDSYDTVKAEDLWKTSERLVG